MCTRAIVTAVAVTGLLGSARPVDAKEYLHPSVRNGEKTVHAIMLLPVEADVIKVGVKGAESQLEQVAGLEREVDSAVQAALASNQLRACECPFTESALAADPDARVRLADFRARYDELAGLVAKNPKGVSEGRFSLGDQVLELVPGTDADALAIVHASRQHATYGMRMLTGAASRTTDLTLTLIDPKSGDVLAHFVISAGGSLDKPVAKAFKKLPR